MARKCKSYEELELSDDFMFAKVMQNSTGPGSSAGP